MFYEDYDCEHQRPALLKVVNVLNKFTFDNLKYTLWA